MASSQTVAAFQVQALEGVFYALSLPFRAARWVSLKLDERATAARTRRGAGAFLKPAWAGSGEL
jgi:hypothetical protein